MTKKEVIQEINKAFEPAFANYIITALTEGTTASDKDEEQVVINIPKEQYSLIMQSHRSGVERFVSKEAIMYAIKNGTRLTKGQPQTQSCDDCVSRQAVLDMATTIQTDDSSGNETMEVVDVDDVKALSPVTPERKTGKWITNSDFPDEIICSCCNTNYDMWFWEQGTMNYCPHCGAEMQEVEHE